MVTQIRLLWKDSKMIRISLTRHDAPRPQEGDGTIWQLNDGTVEESRTVERYSHSEKCKAKEIINSPPSGVRAMKSDWTDCSQGAEAVTWLSSWGEKKSTLCVRAFWWLRAVWLWKISQQHQFTRRCAVLFRFFFFFFWLEHISSRLRKNREQVVHPTPQTSVWNPKYESGIASSLRRTLNNIKNDNSNSMSQFTSFSTKV